MVDGNSYQTSMARGAGGGATDIRFSPNEDPLNVESLLSRVIVAGGGGGNLYNSGIAYEAGSGGGLNGTNGTVGYAGTQTGAGLGYEGYTSAGFGYGGYRPSTSTSTTCGGGGGWYGGGSGNSAGRRLWICLDNQEPRRCARRLLRRKKISINRNRNVYRKRRIYSARWNARNWA